LAILPFGAHAFVLISLTITVIIYEVAGFRSRLARDALLLDAVYTVLYCSLASADATGGCTQAFVNKVVTVVVHAITKLSCQRATTRVVHADVVAVAAVLLAITVRTSAILSLIANIISVASFASISYTVLIAVGLVWVGYGRTVVAYIPHTISIGVRLIYI